MFGQEITAAEAKKLSHSQRFDMKENVQACNVYCDVECCKNSKTSCTGF